MPSPYAFLDDAPLEERRTQAVQSSSLARSQDKAADLGALWIKVGHRPGAGRGVAGCRFNADELHDALVLLGFMTEPEGRAAELGEHFDVLRADGRAAVLHAGPETRLWVAADRLPELRVLYPNGRCEPDLAPPADLERAWEPENAAAEILRGRLESVGPVTAGALAKSSGLDDSVVVVALASLESEGFVLRGRFTPGAGVEEWCERRLLARVHRYTLNRLRSEIQPVTAQQLVQFLLTWQRVAPDARMKGPESVAAVLSQLEGYEAPAAAWEGEVLPARIADYDPSWLDSMCLSGKVVWARVTPPPPGPRGTKSSGPVRATPIALLDRGARALWRAHTVRADVELELTPSGRAVLDVLTSRGACFFDDIVGHAGMLRTQVEEGLAELVAWGLATSDSYSGLRALLTPSSQRRSHDPRRRRRAPALAGMENAGRWSLLARDACEPDGQRAVEHAARALLRRYGVVFRRIIEREATLPPWRDLLRVYRRLEARGEIRGGRFVAGFTGEQYALPDAVASMRALRRKKSSGGVLVSISAADPLNLVGIITPGERVAALASNRVLFRDGEPIGRKVGRTHEISVKLEPAAEWEATNALLRRNVPRPLKGGLGRSA